MTTTAPSALIPVADWPVLRELSGDISQQVFRHVMDAFARPGTLHRLPGEAVPAPLPPALAPLLALTDLMAPLAALSTPDAPSEEAVDEIARLTGAPVVAPEHARFALALSAPEDLARLNRGTHWSPEQGATLVQRVSGAELLAAPEPGAWTLRGPGVPSQNPVHVRVRGLDADWVRTRADLVDDYPAGVDCLLVTDAGDLLALTRTTVLEEN